MADILLVLLIMTQCPRCGKETGELISLTNEMMSQLSSLGESLPPTICGNCYGDLQKSASLSQGGVLLAQEKAKENYRLELWKNRVQLIKKARLQMTAKKFTEAAVTYEKYLKILEIVFGLKPGEVLTPNHFKDSARTTELTIVASVYWDLLRIYDTNQGYREQQAIAAKQLSVFVQFTPIYPDIIRRAEAFVRGAKNPQIIKSFLKDSSKQRPRCFIASSAFESNSDKQVIYLRLFRDYFLNQKYFGQKLIQFYYYGSPFISRVLDRSKLLRIITRMALSVLIKCIRLIY